MCIFCEYTVKDLVILKKWEEFYQIKEIKAVKRKINEENFEMI